MQHTQKVSPVPSSFPENPETLYSEGLSHQEKGRLREAIAIFSFLCSRRPVEVRFWFSLSASLQEAKFYEEALRAWGVAAILQDQNPYPHFHTAECCFQLHHFTDAAQALDRSLDRIEGAHPLLEKIEMLKKQWGSSA